MCVYLFQNLDTDKLESAQRSHHMLQLDRSVQLLGRGLSLLRGHNESSIYVPSSSDFSSSNGGKVSSSKSPPVIKSETEKNEIEEEEDTLTDRDLVKELEDLNVSDNEEQEEDGNEKREETREEGDVDNNDDDDDFDLT